MTFYDGFINHSFTGACNFFRNSFLGEQDGPRDARNDKVVFKTFDFFLGCLFLPKYLNKVHSCSFF